MSGCHNTNKTISIDNINGRLNDLERHKKYQKYENKAVFKCLIEIDDEIKELDIRLDNYREYKTRIEDLETDVMYLKEKYETWTTLIKDVDKKCAENICRANGNFDRLKLKIERIENSFIKSLERINDLELHLSNLLTERAVNNSKAKVENVKKLYRCRCNI